MNNYVNFESKSATEIINTTANCLSSRNQWWNEIKTKKKDGDTVTRLFFNGGETERFIDHDDGNRERFDMSSEQPYMTYTTSTTDDGTVVSITKTRNTLDPSKFTVLKKETNEMSGITTSKTTLNGKPISFLIKRCHYDGSYTETEISVSGADSTTVRNFNSDGKLKDISCNYAHHHSITEYTYDVNGRISGQKYVSPDQVVVTTTTTSYENNEPSWITRARSLSTDDDHIRITGSTTVRKFGDGIIKSHRIYDNDGEFSEYYDKYEDADIVIEYDDDYDDDYDNDDDNGDEPRIPRFISIRGTYKRVGGLNVGFCTIADVLDMNGDFEAIVKKYKNYVFKSEDVCSLEYKGITNGEDIVCKYWG